SIDTANPSLHDALPILSYDLGRIRPILAVGWSRIIDEPWKWTVEKLVSDSVTEVSSVIGSHTSADETSDYGPNSGEYHGSNCSTDFGTTNCSSPTEGFSSQSYVTLTLSL